MNDEPLNDPLPALLAEVDQATKMAPHLARWARGLYEAFVGAGFSESQALTLTINQMRSSLSSSD